MPKINEYRTVKAQVESFKELGFKTEFSIQGFKERFAPKIRLDIGTKQYRFSEENWNVVSLQLAQLYRTIKNEKRMYLRGVGHVANGY